MARSSSSSSTLSTSMATSMRKAFWMGLACGICLTLTVQSIASGFGMTTTSDYYGVLTNSQDLFQYYYDNNNNNNNNSPNASSLLSSHGTSAATQSRKKQNTQSWDPMNMPVQLLRPAASNNKTTATATTSTTTTATTSKQTSEEKVVIRDFERQDGVVIVTKIHGPENWKQYRQSMCLLNAAYNDRLHYDIVLFTTIAIPESDVEEMKTMVAPAKFTIVVDAQTLQEQLQDLTPSQTTVLLERCNRTSLDQLEWELRCNEVNSHTAAIQYLWQAEFRSKHLWTQAVLQPYQTMLWFDSDAMPMKRWEQDPIAIFRRNELVVLFANFPSGKSRGQVFTERMYQTYNQTICGIDLVSSSSSSSSNGGGGNIGGGGKHLRAQFHSSYPCPNGNSVMYNQIHGFFHITNLHFYRNEIGLKWANTLIGDTKFSRKFDDQIAVTVPGAVLAPEKSWDMQSNGINLSVMHNGRINGKGKSPYGWYKDYWKTQGETLFPEAWQKCQGLVVNGGR